MNNLLNVKKILLKVQKFSFSNKLYSSENLKFQKTFKFTSNADKQREIKNKEKFIENKIKIRQLEQEYNNYDNLTYSEDSNKSGKSVIVMKRSDKNLMDDENFEDERLKPVNIAYQNKKNELDKQLKNLKAENERIEIRYLGKNKSSKKDDEVEFMRISHIKDMFSHNYSFANNHLNPLTYEQVNNREAEKPWSVKKEEIEVNEKQNNLEKEISNVLDESISREMSKFDILSTQIPHKLATKPILRSIPADPNQPSFLLVEGDLNVNYDLDLEYERLYRLTKNDDFGQKIKEEQDKDDEKKSVSTIEDDADLFNSGNQPTIISADTSIAK